MNFKVQTVLNASVKEVYSAWLSSEGHSKMTGGEAVISNRIGESFTAWDGYIHGMNLILEADKRIVQSWRTSEFEDHEEDSQIEIILLEKAGKTELSLYHSNLPETGDHYKKGWHDHYFKPMKAYFSR